MLSEITQTEKDEYHVIDYMWNLKKKTIHKLTYLQNRRVPFLFKCF